MCLFVFVCSLAVNYSVLFQWEVFFSSQSHYQALSEESSCLYLSQNNQEQS